MAPLLIDNNGILKLGIIAASITVVVFVGGFYFGYHQADSYHMALTNSHSLLVAKKTISDDSNTVKQQSEKIVERDVVSQTESVKKLVKKLVVKVPEKTVAIKHKEKQVPVSRGKQPSKETSSAASLKNQQTDVKLIANGDKAKAKYSIQVGFYSRLDNAEKKVNKLQEENFYAYVSDYLNKNNDIRFNVRFGYFVDKNSANVALKAFNKNHKSDGYLVNYAGDKLTHSIKKSNFSDTKAVSKLDSNLRSQEAVPSKSVNVSKESAAMVESKAQAKNSDNASVQEIEKTVNR